VGARRSRADPPASWPQRCAGSAVQSAQAGGPAAPALHPLPLRRRPARQAGRAGRSPGRGGRPRPGLVNGRPPAPLQGAAAAVVIVLAALTLAIGGRRPRLVGLLDRVDRRASGRDQLSALTAQAPGSGTVARGPPPFGWAEELHVVGAGGSRRRRGRKCRAATLMGKRLHLERDEAGGAGRASHQSDGRRPSP
jgi:hypothetical protein